MAATAHVRKIAALGTVRSAPTAEMSGLLRQLDGSSACLGVSDCSNSLRHALCSLEADKETVT